MSKQALHDIKNIKIAVLCLDCENVNVKSTPAYPPSMTEF